jgi:hypothetical protein
MNVAEAADFYVSVLDSLSQQIATNHNAVPFLAIDP